MLFVSILFISAASIALTAAYFSVVGLATIFPGGVLSVIIMGSVLELGKLVAASFLYRHWNITSWVIRTYLTIAIFLLMVITSIGIFGQLSSYYIESTSSLKETQSQLELLKQEKIELTERKKQIDVQIAQLPEKYVKARQQLMKSFESETIHINSRLPEISKQLQVTSSDNIQKQAHTGPIVYIAKALNLEIDDATKWIIFIIIIVFDPLAVVLTIAVNILMVNKQIEVGQFSKILSKDTPQSPNTIQELKDYLEQLKHKTELSEEEKRDKNKIEQLLSNFSNKENIVNKIKGGLSSS